MDLEGHHYTDGRRLTADRNHGYGRPTLCRMAAVSELLRSRIIGYVWDATTPAATIIKSQKTGTVTFVVVRSGSKDLGKWLTERRNVTEDYAKIFGEFPDDPRAITISIDSNDTHSMAESFIGPIIFRAQ